MPTTEQMASIFLFGTVFMIIAAGMLALLITTAIGAMKDWEAQRESDRREMAELRAKLSRAEYDEYMKE